MGQYEKLLLALMSGAKDRKVPSPVHAPGLYRRDPVQYAARRPKRRHDQPADHPKQTLPPPQKRPVSPSTGSTRCVTQTPLSCSP